MLNPAIDSSSAWDTQLRAHVLTFWRPSSAIFSRSFDEGDAAPPVMFPASLRRGLLAASAPNSAGDRGGVPANDLANGLLAPAFDDPVRDNDCAGDPSTGGTADWRPPVSAVFGLSADPVSDDEFDARTGVSSLERETGDNNCGPVFGLFGIRSGWACELSTPPSLV